MEQIYKENTQKRNTNTWETLKEIVNIPSHKGNENQNSFVISCHTILNDQDQ